MSEKCWESSRYIIKIRVKLWRNFGNIIIWRKYNVDIVSDLENFAIFSLPKANVNCQQNKKIDEKFTVCLIIFRQILKSRLTNRLFVKCMFIYSVSLSSFRLIAKSLGAYRQTEENSFLVKIQRILSS